MLNLIFFFFPRFLLLEAASLVVSVEPIETSFRRAILKNEVPRPFFFYELPHRLTLLSICFAPGLTIFVSLPTSNGPPNPNITA